MGGKYSPAARRPEGRRLREGPAEEEDWRLEVPLSRIVDDIQCYLAIALRSTMVAISSCRARPAFNADSARPE